MNGQRILWMLAAGLFLVRLSSLITCSTTTTLRMSVIRLTVSSVAASVLYAQAKHQLPKITGDSERTSDRQSSLPQVD